MARGDVAEHIAFARAFDRRAALRGEPRGVQRQITPVGRERVARKTVFDPQRVDEAIDDAAVGDGATPA
jgi:hypothetical protein